MTAAEGDGSSAVAATLCRRDCRAAKGTESDAVPLEAKDGSSVARRLEPRTIAIAPSPRELLRATEEGAADARAPSSSFSRPTLVKADRIEREAPSCEIAASTADAFEQSEPNRTE